MIKRFQRLLAKNKIDLGLISNFFSKDPNFFYFTGLSPEYSFLLIPKKGNPIFMTSKLEYQRARKYSGISDIRMFESPAYQHLAKIANRRGKVIGLNKSIVPINEFRHIKKFFVNKRYKDISGLLNEQRKTKEKHELKNIQKACEITDNIFKDIVSDFKFRTETNLRDFIAGEAQTKGCTLSFDTIVASGRGASIPHYKGRDVKLKKGFLVMDFGVNYQGYMSDMTRTIYIGKPSEHDRRLYGLLLSAQKNAIKRIRPGIKASWLMKTVQDELGRYSKNFIHSLGHGIGVQIHELPNLSLLSKETLEEGMVFTIEPGIYFFGRLGIRIEDDVTIRHGKTVVLTKSDKELLVR